MCDVDVDVASQEEERAAEAELSRRDPDRSTRLWVRGHGAFSASPPPSEEKRNQDNQDKNDTKDNQDKKDTPRPEEEDLAGDSSPSHTQAQPSTAARQSQSQSQSLGSVSDEQRQAALPSSSNSNSNRAEERPHSDVVEAAIVPAKPENLQGEGGQDSSSRGSEEIGEGDREAGEEGEGKSVGVVPDFRLNGFVHVCPLVSEGCKFTAKAWLQDEDD